MALNAGIINHQSNTSKALPSALTLLSVAFFSACKPKPPSTESAVPVRTSELKQFNVNQKIADAVGLLKEGFLLTNQIVPDVLSADKIEITNLNRATATGGLSGGHWDPKDQKIKVEKSLLDNASTIALALMLGHEAVHARFDKVEAKNLTPSQYCDSEIRAHSQEAESIVPALRAALKNRSQLGDFEQVSLDLYETNGRFAALSYQIRKEVYIYFEHNTIPRIQHFLKSDSDVTQAGFELLKEVNFKWRAAIEKRPRTRHEYVMDLENFIQAIEKASAYSGVSVIFHGNSEQLNKAKIYQQEAGKLAKKADELAALQSSLR